MNWTMGQPLKFLLVGVGGQGTILASDLLAEVGVRLGYDVKKAEIHGMSQRGGSVTSGLQWARQVYSPIVVLGSADVLIAFEKLEALRFCGYLRSGGLALINDMEIQPVTVASGGPAYLSDEVIRAGLARVTSDSCWIDGTGIAEAAGNARASNLALIGALAARLALPEKALQAAIELRVPARFREVNQRAYQAGKLAVQPA
jgi:indolepyruvate ferredoxin oxidoreductase beta subunit